jgi:hypothetical protein
MKFLKSFNEDNKSILYDICKNHIAYIVDNIIDFKFSIHQAKVPDNLYIKSKYMLDDEIYQVCFFRSNPNHNRFSWNDVKTDFIPIVEILNRNYSVVDIIIFTNSGRSIKKINPEPIGIDHHLDIDDIIDDNIINDVNDILTITLIVKI